MVLETSNRQEQKQKEQSPKPSHMECLWLAHEKLKSENELTNQRLGWNFSFNALLSAAYGLCIQALWAIQGKISDLDKIHENRNSDQYATLAQSFAALKGALHWMPIAGILVSIMIFVGALAAQIAIMSIRGKYKSGHPDNCDDDVGHGEDWPPEVVGGGSMLAHVLGWVPLGMPWVFVFIWWQLKILGPH
jgi:hypothetical protein